MLFASTTYLIMSILIIAFTIIYNIIKTNSLELSSFLSQIISTGCVYFLLVGLESYSNILAWIIVLLIGSISALSIKIMTNELLY
jgi:hypothetical protein